MFPDIWMFALGSPGLKKIKVILRREVPVLFHPSLYKVVKLTYPMDVGRIVLDERMTSELVIESLGQSVRVLSGADFRPVCE